MKWCLASGFILVLSPFDLFVVVDEEANIIEDFG